MLDESCAVLLYLMPKIANNGGRERDKIKKIKGLYDVFKWLM